MPSAHRTKTQAFQLTFNPDHALRRPDRRRNRLPRLPKSLDQKSARRRNDHVQRLNLHAGAGPAALQGHGPHHAVGRSGVDWRVGGVGCCVEGEERCAALSSLLVVTRVKAPLIGGRERGLWRWTATGTTCSTREVFGGISHVLVAPLCMIIVLYPMHSFHVQGMVKR
jgi:hypothetical protein